MVGFWADGNGANEKGHANELAVGRAGETRRSPRLVAKRMDSVSPETVTPTVKGGLQEREWPGGWVGVPWVGGADNVCPEVQGIGLGQSEPFPGCHWREQGQRYQL